ncbi:MAG: Asp-tRNA(Asn)/Glu-tRNA(Gln) amidotransferase subunit GatA [Chlamydiae bacterium]|nr:Asp-tRNA(Asn)/Glu-tRNA(Gln) amidotransferase subunit GatA [Chlamydiota bacterium]
MYSLSAKQLSSLVKEGKISAVEVTRYFLKRAEAIDPSVKAFLTLFPEKALAKAHAIDEKIKQGKSVGKLAGVPVAIKDNIHIESELTTCASKFLADYKAPFSATAVRRIEEEDGILLGKTNLDEFAMGSSTETSAFFETRNPWNLSCTPGGSSGGSAAAVASRIAPLSIGSDTGGSIRQPASFCGTFGFKPTYGRISRYGLVAFGSSFDQIGPFANYAEDIALMMDVLAGHCPLDSTSIADSKEDFSASLSQGVENMTIGVPRNLLKELDPSLIDLFNNAINEYVKMGVKVVEIDIPLIKYSIPLYYILAIAEASTNLARFDGILFSKRSTKAKTLKEVYEYSKEEGFGKEVKRRILLGTYVLSAGHQDAYYKKAQKVRRLLIEDFKRIFQTCDAVVLPTVPSAAFELGAIKNPLEMYLQDIYTIFANLAGLPAISMPIGLDKNQKPFGLQISSAQMQDAKVLRLSAALEQQLKLQTCPPLFAKEFS